MCVRQKHCFPFWLLRRWWKELKAWSPEACPACDLCDPQQVMSPRKPSVSIPGKLRVGREQQLSIFFKKVSQPYLQKSSMEAQYLKQI